MSRTMKLICRRHEAAYRDESTSFDFWLLTIRDDDGEIHGSFLVPTFILYRHHNSQARARLASVVPTSE